LREELIKPRKRTNSPTKKQSQEQQKSFYFVVGKEKKTKEAIAIQA
jgi:hypothetical protein